MSVGQSVGGAGGAEGAPGGGHQPEGGGHSVAAAGAAGQAGGSSEGGRSGGRSGNRSEKSVISSTSQAAPCSVASTARKADESGVVARRRAPSAWRRLVDGERAPDSVRA